MLSRCHTEQLFIRQDNYKLYSQVSKRLAENCTLEKGEERTVCGSIKSITYIYECLPVYQCVDTIVQIYVLIIKPRSSTPEWLAARIAPSCTMNLQRDIIPTLTTQLTVSVVTNRVIWCLYNHNVRCFPAASHLGLQAGDNHSFNDKVQLDILDGYPHFCIRTLGGN